MEGQENRKGSRRGRDRPEGNRPGGIRPLLAFLAGIALLAAAAFFLAGRQKPAEGEGLVYEANIVSGDIPGKTREERQRELDAIVEEGMLAMSINATPVGKTTGTDRNINWLVENPSNQGKLIRVEVWLDSQEELIYETGAIPPGNYVESAPLRTELPPGEYNCTARFYAYQEDTETYIGQAAA